jgi:hypothetical protein
VSAATAPRLNVGDRVRFAEERQAYTVRAVSPDGRYAICTKPFNLHQTVLYCIVDFQAGFRSSDDRVFCRGYETQADIDERMRELLAGKIALSWRRRAELNIAEMVGVKGAK